MGHSPYIIPRLPAGILCGKEVTGPVTPERTITEGSCMEDFSAAREDMVRSQLLPRGIADPRVLRAMRSVPRERFVGKAMIPHAYEDRPLPIGEDQTISQPYIVALMTEALGLEGGEKTLEIGTGSGYQAAILAELSREVYTVERLPHLLDRARRILETLGYENIFFKIDDGTMGWKDHGPYDAIIVTAAAPGIPGPLKEQMAEDGRLIIPVGDRYSQTLIRVTREDGGLFQEDLGGCRFVPLKGAYGWP